MSAKPTTRNHIRPSIPKLDDIPVYRAREVAKIIRVSPTTFYRWLGEGKFPRGVQVFDLKPPRWSLNTIREAIGISVSDPEDCVEDAA
jgi:predicted DNA-binding transcriptional regulator AlpA